MYDRSSLVAAAQERDDLTPSDLARRLGVARNTGWRLWTGRGRPSAELVAAVERHYGIPAEQLVMRAAA